MGEPPQPALEPQGQPPLRPQPPAAAPVPSVYHNRISWFSTGVAGYSLSLMAILHLTNVLLGRPNPYLGVLTYLVLPVAFVAGVAGIVAGMGVEARRRRRRGAAVVLPVIDLNALPARRRFVQFWFASFGFVVVLSLTAYGGYQYTESVPFCGETCHTVMEPTYTAYQRSAHARVPCTECHIGPGADWWVRSKLSGVYQVYAYARNLYRRPIPVPIESLRPARETCETCHWPAKFYDSVLRRRRYFSTDPSNSAWEVHLEIPVGGGQGPFASGGVHWHVLPENQVYYVAADPARQEIPWVKAVRPDGSEVVFQHEDRPPEPEAVAAAKVRRMDCIDCHNQPSHMFKPPARALDEALAFGAISPGLPEIKSLGAQVLTASYPSREAAEQAIRARVTEFYRTEYPQVARENPAAVEGAVRALVEIYRTNVFPEMKTDWRAYPDNRGHLFSPGCFRCHDGRHVSADGQAIPSDCNTCHRIVAQGPPGQLSTDPAGMSFVHPMDASELTTPQACWECHDGTAY